jgi:hypothetical protein
MITEEEFEAASDGSPEMAFVRLERKFRAAYEKNLETSDSNGSFNHYSIEYMNHVVAAAKALGLDLFDFWELPFEHGSDMYEQYKKFRTEVDHFTVQIQIAHIRSGPKNSVALDPSEKKHLRAYAERIKDIIDKSSLATAKKERLFDRLNAFIAELDRDRTPLQKFTDIIMALSTAGADAAEELEPTWKWVRLGAAILGVRQETEQTKIPAPPKKIEGPKRQLPPPQKQNGRPSLDDEIPF